MGVNIWNAATKVKWSVKANSLDISAVYTGWILCSGYDLWKPMKKTPTWILLGADIQTEETALLLDMHMIRTLQNVRWKYWDSQLLNNLPRAIL